MKLSITATAQKILMYLPVLVMLCSCAGITTTYKAYEGETRQARQLSLVEGARFNRQDWLNRYVDSVRFASVDGNLIEHSDAYRSIQITPGFHDLRVYFFWDLGSQRGLAPALVSYASSRDTLSRTLRFNALAGESYLVRAQPVFRAGRREITTLLHVNFWIVDRQGNEIVSREEGRYTPGR